ncbi:MAG: PAS domain S-box protein [Desulfobacterales bacterium]|jgi:PAS domain S-box-containing protein
MAFIDSQEDVNLPELMELNYQKYLIKVFMIVGLPILGIFMIHDFLTGKYLVALVLFLIFSLITGLFFIINKPSYKVKKGPIFRYFFTIVFILFGIYLAYSIGFQGDFSRIPWAYLFPVMVFFALGAVRALIWVSILYCGLLILGQFFPSNEQILIQELKLRFYISFIMVMVASFFFERLKKGYQLELMDNQQTLKESENRYREAFEQLNGEMKERRRAEENLRKSEERFREMADHIREVFWLFDWEKQKVIYVSPAYEVIWGRSIEGLYHRYDEWAESIHPDDLEYARSSFEEIIQTGGGEKREYRIVRPDGSVRWVSDRGFAIKDKAGQVVRVAGIAEDITDRKQSEVALRESEERFRELAELMPETVFEVDLEGNLTFVNRNAFNYFGYTPQDLKKGLKSFDMIIPKDRERARNNVTKILKGEKSGINEYTALRKDGSTFPVMIHSAPIFKAGKPVGLRGFIVDITERKRAEEERRKLEVQFQQAQRFEALGTLAGGIAHDFNNLMMNIQGNTSLMLFEIENDHPFFEPLKKIEKQVKSGAQLTRQMLGYARKGKFNVKSVDLNQILDESADTFGRTRKEITIHREFDKNLFPVEADQGQIEQVLLNLYVNAADAMPGGGKLILTTKNETHLNIKSNHYDPKPGKYVQLTITDSGIGMDPQTLERIFDPFFTTKDMGRGTGLGLASVYGIIKSHDGYIDVESEKGHGTTFTIFLPATEKGIEDKAEAKARLIKGSGTLLIVDDEELVLDVGANMLKKLGYTVLKAHNGTEAVDVFKANKNKIKMVILDIIMPDMGGGAVYDKIKSINPEVKVLLSSGYSVDGQAIELLERGCDGFMQKPFTMEELSGKITQILKN